MSMKRHAPSPFRGRTLPAALAAAMLSVALLPPVLAQSAGARFRGAPVTLNFVNADIEGVARAMAVILKQQFLVDPRVKGNITLYSDEALTPREAYLSFLAALRGLGFTVVEVGGLFKVVPEADAKLQTGTVSVGEVSRRGDQVITQIFRLGFENANNLVPILRPLISPNNTINANPGNNSLVITDYADNLQRIAKIIAAMDTPAGGDIEVIPLKNAVASDIAALVQRLTETAGAPGLPSVPGSAPPAILVDARSNSLVVRAPNPSRMAGIRSLINKLDQPPQGSATTGNTWVVHLKNADATKLAAVLRAAFSSSGASAGGAGGGAATSLLNPTQAPAGTGGAAGMSTASSTPISASAGPSTGGFVQADPSTNSLIISAPEPMYRQLRMMIDQLDSRRAQVYIESMIVEVSGDNAADFGFQWQGLIGKSGDKTGLVGGTNFTPAGGAGNIISLQAGAAAGTVSLGEGINIGLLRNYGGVPIITKVYNLSDDFTTGVARATIEQTVDYIVKELDAAAALLPMKHSGPDVGRATKGACMALKARTLLYGASPLYTNTATGDVAKYTKAAEAAKAVVDLGQYSLYPNYAQVFTAIRNQEVILDEARIRKSGWQWMERFNGPNGFGGWAGNMPSQTLIDEYETADGKLITETGSTYNAQEPYKNRDPRLAATILYNGTMYRSRALETFVPGGKDTKDGIEPWNTSLTGYYLRKFMYEDASISDGDNYGNNHWVFMRYGEVLLNYAEALNESGKTAEAYAPANQVRVRAKMPVLPAGLSQTQMREKLRHERQIELAYEEHRFYDVRRWKIAMVTDNKPIRGADIRKDASGKLTYTYQTIQERKFMEKHYWLPIPIKEVQANSKITQNPLY